MASGIERSRPATAPAADTNMSTVNWLGSRLNSGAMRMPARPASEDVSTTAWVETRRGLTARRLARSRRSTTARICRPTWVRRIRYHRPTDTTIAAKKTASWSELRVAPLAIFQVRAGYGPMPGWEQDQVPRGQVDPGRLGEPVRQDEHEVRQGDQDPDGRHDLGDGRRGGQVLEDQPVEQQAEQRREDQEGDEGRRQDRQPEPHVQLVVDVGDGERQRPVGEVEHARGDVGQHQARGEDRVDPARDGARDQQREESGHRLPSRTGGVPPAGGTPDRSSLGRAVAQAPGVEPEEPGPAWAHVMSSLETNFLSTTVTSPLHGTESVCALGKQALPSAPPPSKQ